MPRSSLLIKPCDPEATLKSRHLYVKPACTARWCLCGTSHTDCGVHGRDGSRGFCIRLKLLGGISEKDLTSHLRQRGEVLVYQTELN